MIERHGVEYVGQAEISKQKTKEAFLEKYGVDSYSKTKEFKQHIAENKESISAKAKVTFLRKYGVDTALKVPEFQNKRTNTVLIKYGKDNFNNRKKARETALKRYGTTNIFAIPAVQSKQQATKRKNGTFNTSMPEERIYIKLCEKYGSDHVVRQYKDPRYPFMCDFYVKNLDLFIELNVSWTHGGHPFDCESAEDKTKLLEWQEKSKTSQYYKNAITTWTARDVNKFKTAKNNKLNYKAFYTEAEAVDFINSKEVACF